MVNIFNTNYIFVYQIPNNKTKKKKKLKFESSQ